MLSEVERMIQSENYDGLMEWAFTNDNPDSSKEILKSVADAYKLLIDKGYGIAANNLGSMYYCGRYFMKNALKAIRYYQIAMETGEKLAWSNLGCCYYYDLKDYQKAFEVFAEGAALFNDPESLYMLGDMYRYGCFVDANKDKAYQLYRRSAMAVNMDDERERSLLGDAYCRIGSLLLESDNQNQFIEGIRTLYSGISYLYERIHETPYVDADIRKYRKMLKDAEDALYSEIIYPKQA